MYYSLTKKPKSRKSTKATKSSTKATKSKKDTKSKIVKKKTAPTRVKVTTKAKKNTKISKKKVVSRKSKKLEVSKTTPQQQSIPEEQLTIAKSIVNDLRQQDIIYIKNTLNSIDKANWNEWMHVGVNGCMKKTLTIAMASILEIQ
jgi:DNA polymerase elongation subunit (family B)